AIPAATAAGFGNSWEVALGAVFISGLLFLILSLIGVREALVNAVSPGLKIGIAVGIGLFIAFIGLQNAGLIVKDSGTLVKLNPPFSSPDVVIFFCGLLLTLVLHARRVRGSILWGILGATLSAAVSQFVLTQMPESIATAKLVKESLLMTRFKLANG